ncbi:alpha/beta fold hydrolase BchO [uncultured Rhodoblastus sp.]|uniref:alpha/beta fold hydrolase BchO n=1 Tax=uncultured Rhodoblastus sp. TaxID=543037 RepID=UPI0025CE52F8|nr:alpha/beta fold hydrolase BchO [uncultured Rhodoblastus sp.]
MKGLDFAREGADWPLRESSRFVVADGFRWHVQDIGSGPPALLVHGAAGATHSWRGLSPLLAEHYRVIAPDLPGHGFTTSERWTDRSLKGYARALAALLARLDVAPKLVIGHSAGAAILARLIAEGRLEPDLFVAINGAFLPFEGFGGQIFPVLARLLHLNPLAARFVAWSADRGSVAQLIAGMGSKLDAQGLDLYARLMQNPAHCAGALEMMANWDLTRMPEDLRRIAIPALLIVGENDKAIRPDDAEKIAKFLPRAKIIRLPGLGHLAHEEDPRAVADQIEAAQSAFFAD